MRGALRLLTLLCERYPLPADGHGPWHNLTMQDGELRLYVCVGIGSDGATDWQPIKIEPDDLDQDVDRLFGEITALIDTLDPAEAIH